MAGRQDDLGGEGTGHGVSTVGDYTLFGCNVSFFICKETRKVFLQRQDHLGEGRVSDKGFLQQVIRHFLVAMFFWTMSS